MNLPIIRRLRRSLERLRPSGSLASRTAKSGVWWSATNAVQRVLQLTMWLTVARLLGPAEVGLMGLTLITLKAFKEVSRLGLDTALIQRTEDDVDRFLDTVWSLQTLRGLGIAGIAAATAPLLASLFNAPGLAELLPVVGLVPVLRGVSNPGVVYFRKRLQFHRNFLYNVSVVLVQFVVTVVLAVVLGTVWAIAIGYLAMGATTVVVSYCLHSYRPRPGIDPARAKELIDFGKWLTASGLIYFLIKDGDDLVVGALLTSASLGFYQMAYRLANAPATEITQVVSGVVFPAYSKLQDDPETFREAYHLVLRVTTALTFPAAVGIIVVAAPFVRAFLGPDWLPMVTTLQLIAVYGLVYSVASTFGPVWNALGRPDITTKVGVLRLALIAALIVPATARYGIDGTALVVIAGYLLPALPIDLYLLTSLIGTTYRRLIGDIVFPLAASLGMGASVVLLRGSIGFESALLEFVALVGIGVVAYGAFVALLERGLQWGIVPTVREIYGAVAQP